MNTQAETNIFKETVHKAEQLVEQNLSRYKLNLLLFALLGYGVIFLLILGLVGVTAGSVWLAFFSTTLFLLLLKKKVIFIIIPTIWVMLKALWVKIEPPRGYEVDREKCPQLFEEIDQISAKLKTAKIHQVLLTPEFNAAIIQTPRLGVLGWEKNTLVLGVELLLALSPEQARSVIAHELGHLSGNHSRFAGWIYRVRESWYRIMLAFQEADSFGARLMSRFFNWYSPRFSAYSFVLARANEYEADMIAAEMTSSQATADALIKSHVVDSFLYEQYWQNFLKRAENEAAPPHGPWSGLSNFIDRNSSADPDIESKISSIKEHKTDYADTHPCLMDRLDALDKELIEPGAIEESAAKCWLGQACDDILSDFDEEWMGINREQWKERYEYAVEGKKSLVDFAERNVDELSDEELWNYSCFTEDFGEKKDALKLYRKYQERYPDNPKIAFAVGRMLLQLGDESFLEEMKIALEAPDITFEVCHMAYQYLMDHGRENEALWWDKKAENHQVLMDESHNERSLLARGDTLKDADIHDDLKTHIISTIEEFKEVREVWLAEKKMKHFPDVPAIALAIRFKAFSRNHNKLADQIAEKLDLDCTLFVVPHSGEFKALYKMIRKAGEQLI